MSELTSSDLALVASALAALAPDGVRTGCRRITGDDLATLRPGEALAVERAVPRRREEFATGRALLRGLVRTDAPILVGPDRAPELPTGVVASLAHCHGLAVAAVAPDGVAAALGLDVEPATALDDAMGRAILRADDPSLDAHLAFTLKEAVYKAWSRLGGRMLDHHDVRLLMGVDDAFRGVVVHEGAVIEGRWTEVAGHWLALVAVPIRERRGHATVGR